MGLPRVPEKTEKQQGPKLFHPGQSGNPKGRPRGSRNRATLLAQELLGDEGETIMRKAIELAKKGDKLALKLCLERIVPRPGRTVEIDLPAVKKADDLVAACAAVIDSAAAGSSRCRKRANSWSCSMRSAKRLRRRTWWCGSSFSSTSSGRMRQSRRSRAWEGIDEARRAPEETGSGRGENA